MRVRETVPDSVFDRADAVELVDLTPDDLIQRLKEGKVYVPKQAERALEHFFSPANLTALRELALRRTAERVDEQLLTQMQARAIPGPWAAGERVLVCVSEDPRAAGLVRYAKRLADRLHAPWTALYVETPAQPAAQRGAARPHRRHAAAGARRSAARPITIPGGDRSIADDVIGYRAGQQRHPDHHRQVDPLALVRDPARLGGARPGAAQSGNISVHVIAGDELAGEPIPKKTVRPRQTTAVLRSASLRLSRCWPLPSRSASAS